MRCLYVSLSRINRSLAEECKKGKGKLPNSPWNKNIRSYQLVLEPFCLKKLKMANNYPLLTMSRFNGEEFDYWSNLIKLCLNLRYIWSVVEEGINPPLDNLNWSKHKKLIWRVEDNKIEELFSKSTKELKSRFRKGFSRQKWKRSMPSFRNDLLWSRLSKKCSFAIIASGIWEVGHGRRW